jgi:hypothetical protein
VKISLLRISNILGIKDLEVSPGRYTEITGANGVNKSSVLNAIKSVIEGGHDATLLRNGADKGEVVLLLDDGMEIRKTVTPKASRVEVKKGDLVMRRPQETIAALADLFSVNPIAFLSASKADRARVLLESMPIALDRERLSAITGTPLPDWQAGVHPLAALDVIRQGIYDARTAINVQLKEKRGTIEQLRKAMPDVPGAGDANETALEESIKVLELQCAADVAELETKVAQWMQTRDARAAELDAAWQELATQTSAAKERRVARLAAIREQYAAKTQPIAVMLGIARANRSALAKREQTSETIASLGEQIAGCEAHSEQHTHALKALDAYKVELLASLPIPDVEVKNGEIYRGGIPFDRLNTAQRIAIAVELAKLRAGKLRIVCIDGAEALDTHTMEAFKAATAESQLQFFVTKVTDGALHVATDAEVRH